MISWTIRPLQVTKRMNYSLVEKRWINEITRRSKKNYRGIRHQDIILIKERRFEEEGKKKIIDRTRRSHLMKRDPVQRLENRKASSHAYKI